MPEFLQELLRNCDQATLIWIVVGATILLSALLMTIFDVVTPDEGEE